MVASRNHGKFWNERNLSRSSMRSQKPCFETFVTSTASRRFLRDDGPRPVTGLFRPLDNGGLISVRQFLGSAPVGVGIGIGIGIGIESHRGVRPSPRGCAVYVKSLVVADHGVAIDSDTDSDPDSDSGHSRTVARANACLFLQLQRQWRRLRAPPRSHPKVVRLAGGKAKNQTSGQFGPSSNWFILRGQRGKK